VLSTNRSMLRSR